MRRSALLAVFVVLTLFSAVAEAQVIPSPAQGRQLFIRNRQGTLVERLQPNGNQYDVYDTRRSRFSRIGYAKLLGRRMVIYDLNNRVAATMRPELLPPDSPLPVITIVRDPNGHAIGTLERY